MNREQEPTAASCPLQWPRAIVLVDMNAFFASVEQRDFPELAGRPIAVTNGEQGTTIITCSYEARAFGIKTGMRLKEARERCPDLIQRPTRPKAYAAVSSAIMAGLRDICPDIEVFSVDEAFIDVTRCQKLHGSPVRIARMVKQQVETVSGLKCSVGVSGDKTTAKFAAKLHKPDGFTVIPPWEARQRLADLPTTELSGIAKGIGAFLASHGVHTCGQMSKLPISVLARRFGNLGRRIWLMCQGEDPDTIHQEVAPPKSIGHGKVVPPGTREREVLLTFFLHMSEKVGARLRRHNMEAQRFLIGWKGDYGWSGDKLKLPLAGNDGRAIFRLCRFTMENHWHGEPVHQIQVTALDPRPAKQQLDLFADSEVEHEENTVMDAINERYGDFALTPARLLQRSEMPDVIAPAWKPDGHRKTV
ncbi:MAG: DNA polymerase Y family protein [Pseudomonadota bacterium]